MNSAPELLSHCAASGVELWEENGCLRYHGAASIVDPLLPDLSRFKLALIELLEARDNSPGITPDDETARERVRPELRARFRDADVLKIGHNLLRLDAELDIDESQSDIETDL